MNVPLEKYLEMPRIKDLPQETKDEIVRVRTTYEYMSFEMFKELKKQRLLKVFRNLKKPHSFWVDEEGRIWYFDRYHKAFNYCAFFYSTQFLEERTAKEEAYRAEVLENRRKKKEAKQKPTVEIPQKKKRKRITNVSNRNEINPRHSKRRY